MRREKTASVGLESDTRDRQTDEHKQTTASNIHQIISSSNKISSEPNQPAVEKKVVQDLSVKKKPVRKELKGPVGFQTYFEQKKRRRKSPNLRIVVVGEKGVGKSCLIQTLLSDAIIDISTHQQFTQYKAKIEALSVTVTEFKGEEILKLFILTLYLRIWRDN